MSYKKGFTLIELLVVVSIIAILASVILARLSDAKARGQEAAIKSNLKNMTNQAEISYTNNVPNSYTGVCAGLNPMMTAINNSGGKASCYTYDNTRWAATAKLNSDSSKNWSASNEGMVGGAGVFTWGTSEVGFSVTHAFSTTTCANAGGRLPTVEELKALSLSYNDLSIPGWAAGAFYWTSTSVPGDNTSAYVVGIGNGMVAWGAKTNGEKARCVF